MSVHRKCGAGAGWQHVQKCPRTGMKVGAAPLEGMPCLSATPTVPAASFQHGEKTGKGTQLAKKGKQPSHDNIRRLYWALFNGKIELGCYQQQAKNLYWCTILRVRASEAHGLSAGLVTEQQTAWHGCVHGEHPWAPGWRAVGTLLVTGPPLSQAHISGIGV